MAIDIVVNIDDHEMRQSNMTRGWCPDTGWSQVSLKSGFWSTRSLQHHELQECSHPHGSHSALAIGDQLFRDALEGFL